MALLSGTTKFGLEGGAVFGAADNPAGGLPDDFALVIHEKDGGAGGLDGVGEGVLHREVYHGFGARGFELSHFDGQCRTRNANAREEKQADKCQELIARGGWDDW